MRIRTNQEKPLLDYEVQNAPWSEPWLSAHIRVGGVQ